ncbi:MAG: ATP-binding cassette domain-containing protein, partial [Bacteroidales bacterium]|nr:ATP-binding cassette domain-containing protein [Bacteroidales bacterium]
MSEEVLRALMELFAIIIKQDGGLSEREKSYVHRFLVQQIGIESAQKYFALFLATANSDQDKKQDNKKHLTSVLDSVKILKIGKKISKTLNQQQKVVVLIRAIELINTEYKLTDQRQEIIKTLADVFRINRVEYKSMLNFATGQLTVALQDAHILVISQRSGTAEGDHVAAEGSAGDESAGKVRNKPDADAAGTKEEPAPKRILVESLDRPIHVLRVPSVELYFLKYAGNLEIQLNGHPLHVETIYILANGSSIRLPVGQPLYYSDIVSRFLSNRSTVRISLTARKISYSFSQHVKGLQDITFSAEQGNLVGIMGASGSGKTTLLNVLSGVYTPTSGELFINNTDLFREPEKLRGIMGYVPQDDLLVEELTVFQNLWYNAKFCFSDLPDEKIREKVDNMLDQLGLLEKKDLKVGSLMNKTISGGQRKRLNIALELIREPAILFLDEPTSGLSSRDSENVIDLLRQLAIRGKLVFNVIHQPSSELYKMFDQVIVLDEGGQMVYFGNPVEAVVHFRKIDQQVNYGIGECPVCGNTNPEQIFNIIEARQVDEFGNYTSQRKISPEKWREYFEA